MRPVLSARAHRTLCAYSIQVFANATPSRLIVLALTLPVDVRASLRVPRFGAVGVNVRVRVQPKEKMLLLSFHSVTVSSLLVLMRYAHINTLLIAVVISPTLWVQRLDSPNTVGASHCVPINSGTTPQFLQ